MVPETGPLFDCMLTPVSEVDYLIQFSLFSSARGNFQTNQTLRVP